MGILNDTYKYRQKRISVGDIITYVSRYDDDSTKRTEKIIGIYSTSKYLANQREYCISPPTSEFESIKLEELQDIHKWIGGKYIFIMKDTLEDGRHHVCPFTTPFFRWKV